MPNNFNEDKNKESFTLEISSSGVLQGKKFQENA